MAERSVELQKIIFTRWCAQKLSKVGVEVQDITKQLSDGWTLVKLLEVLSEKPCTEKLDPAEKIKNNKFAKIANIDKALKFCFNVCGIQMKIKPSNENLFDGTVKECLGLIWAIMFKYMKIEDDDDDPKATSYNAKDALLMWVKNKLQGYNLKVEGWGKDWHDGMALCALLHKHRPKLLDFSALSPANKTQNIQVAIDSANKYFDLEKYLKPDDIPKLDENSMFVYVSEYYYGIAEQRKLDLAAKRIGKVIKLTVENDAMKKQYNETAMRFKENVKKVEKVLEDRTIDNTMAGARKRLEDFYNYKQNEKSGIISDSLDLEALFNNLATRLAHNKRPAFVPPEGVSLKDIEKTVKHLEECEQERKVSLHKELNRQLRLLSLDEQHKTRFGKLKKWIEEKDAFLRKKELIESVSAAQLHLRLLDAYDKEAETTLKGTVATIKELGAEMIKELYERSSEVQQREKEVDDSFQTLASLSKAKRPVLDDDLEREIFKEKVRLCASQHGNQWDKICQWIVESEKYLETRESVTSIAEANTQLSLLEAFEEEKKNVNESSVSQLKSLGKQVLEAKYETQYSNWVYEKPDEIRQHEKHVDDKWQSMSEQSAEKKRVLEDHLKRETFKAKVLMTNRNHISKHEKLVTWFNEKAKYLQVKEEINSVTEAQTQLTLLDSYEEEKDRTTKSNVQPLKNLGAEIKSMKYESTYSSYVFETPGEIDDRENDIDKKWQELTSLSGQKRKVLQEDLEREKEKERLRVEFATLANDFVVWSKERSEDAGVFDFGFELEEVEAYAKTLENSNNEIAKTRSSKEEAYNNIWNKMQEMKVTENPYTQLTPQDLTQAAQNLQQALDAKKQAYEKELERQRYNDKICREFADLAEPFIKWINETKENITASQASLEDQLKFVAEKIGSQSTDGAKLSQIRDAQKKIDDAGVTNNRHTTLTAQDVDVQWKQYGDFLEKKKKMIETEIEHHKLRGITPEQFQEIEEQFKTYDADKSGNIDRKELKACLYSLGEEKNNKEITEILTKYGDGKAIKYDGFKEFMIDTLGVSDTKEDIINGFFIINRQKSETKTTRAYMEQVMQESDITYVEQTAPKLEDGYNYRDWTEDVFSR